MFKIISSTKKNESSGTGTGTDVNPVEKAGVEPPASKQKLVTTATNKKVEFITTRTGQYHTFTKQLNALIAALRKNRECMIHHRKANQEVSLLVHVKWIGKLLCIVCK
jgi:hypothetical protein